MKATLPYDYSRCGTKGCTLGGTCMRKTPGREQYQSYFSPQPSETCKYYINAEEWNVRTPT